MTGKGRSLATGWDSVDVILGLTGESRLRVESDSVCSRKRVARESVTVGYDREGEIPGYRVGFG